MNPEWEAIRLFLVDRGKGRGVGCGNGFGKEAEPQFIAGHMKVVRKVVATVSLRSKCKSMNKDSIHKNTSGFTLIELLIVIAIIGILFGLFFYWMPPETR